jgi:hypothetical protein
MIHRKKIFILLALLCSLPNLAFALSKGPSISTYPAFPNKINSSQFTVELKPGSSATETVEIVNNSVSPIKYVLSGVDFIEKGNYKTSTDPQTEAGLWIVPENKSVTLESEEKARINFSVVVPENAELKDYKAGLSIEVQNIGTTKKNGMNLAVNLRKVETVNIKVTNDPKPIEKMPPPSLPWTKIYLGVSIGVFSLAALYLIVSQLKKHHARKSAHKPESTHHHKK